MTRQCLVIILPILAFGCERTAQDYAGASAMIVDGKLVVGEFAGHLVVISDETFTPQMTAARTAAISDSLRALVIEAILRDQKPERGSAKWDEGVSWLAKYHAATMPVSPVEIEAAIAEEMKALGKAKQARQQGIGWSEYKEYQRMYPTIEAIDERLSELRKSPPQVALFYREGRVLYREILAGQAVCPDRRVIADREELQRLIEMYIDEDWKKRYAMDESDYRAYFAVFRANYCLSRHIMGLLKSHQIQLYDERDCQMLKNALEKRIKNLAFSFAKSPVVRTEKSIR